MNEKDKTMTNNLQNEAFHRIANGPGELHVGQLRKGMRKVNTIGR